MPKPSACNDDRAIVVATFCWTTVRARPRRPPIRERAPFFVRWRDHDPSRIALSRDNGDFGRRAWRDHVELPDSAAELPFDCRGGLLARRFRCSRYDLDHTGDRQKPESGSERTETFCKTPRIDACGSASPALRITALCIYQFWQYSALRPLVYLFTTRRPPQGWNSKERSTGSPIPPRFSLPANSIDPTAVDISSPLRLTPSIRGSSQPATCATQMELFPFRCPRSNAVACLQQPLTFLPTRLIEGSESPIIG